MTERLLLTFDVACTPEHAFRTWTAAIGTWWPRDHTVSGSAAVVVLDPGVGGRIFERAADGREHDWGEITAWDPPTHLAFRWHLAAARRTRQTWTSASSPMTSTARACRSSTADGTASGSRRAGVTGTNTAGER